MIFASGAKSNDFLVSEDLYLDWRFYDEDEDLMLPFLDNGSTVPYSIHLKVETGYGKEVRLKMEIPSNSSLFVDGKFIQKYDSSSTRYFALDSIRQILHAEAIDFTLFNKKGFRRPTEASIGYLKSSFDASLDVNPVKERSLDHNRDYLKVIILIILTFFVIIHSLFPDELSEFYSIGSLLTFRFTDTFLTKYRSITKIQSLVIVFEAAVLSAIMLIAINYYNNPFTELYFIEVSLIVNWLIIFLITLVLIFLKYLLIGSISVLFGIPEKTNYYFIEYLRLSMLFYTVVFIVLSYTLINHFYYLENLMNALIYAVIGFYFLRFVIIYFKFQRNIAIKNLHLFSYLCTTELIPMVVGLEFFIR